MSITSVCYRVPWPPSVNHYWLAKGHTRFISEAGREFREAVTTEVATPPNFRGRLAVSLELIMPDNRRRDVDNIAKAVLDALCHAGVFQDDCQVDDLRICRRHVESPGCVDIVVQEIAA